MNNKRFIVIVVVIVVVIGATLYYRIQRDELTLPPGGIIFKKEVSIPKGDSIIMPNSTTESGRQLFTTDGVKHSIPLDEILSGGPAKDGIPSIDNPKFLSTKKGDEFLDSEDIGVGVSMNGTSRFYPYQILVWHELVNDEINGDPILVSYCPLCGTAIVFDRRLSGVATEFGVSGKLWQSNLLMYNRTSDPEKESLWSQVLGEAVVGAFTGSRLTILSADTIRYGDWKQAHPDTKVLSRDTGTRRDYGSDPYGEYYSSSRVSFGASFSDDRLHPKALTYGIEMNGKYKAYADEALAIGTTQDSFEEEQITIERNEFGEINMFITEERKPLPYVTGFWFSWLAVHPDTELYQ